MERNRGASVSCYVVLITKCQHWPTRFPFYTHSMAKKKSSSFSRRTASKPFTSTTCKSRGLLLRQTNNFNCLLYWILHENRPEIMKFYPHLQKISRNSFDSSPALEMEEKRARFCQKIRPHHRGDSRGQRRYFVSIGDGFRKK